MKNLILMAIYLVFSVFYSCQNENGLNKKLKNSIENLKPLTISQHQKDSINRYLIDNESFAFPVYSATGDLMTSTNLKKERMNMTVDVYGKEIRQIKAVVYRKLTNAELDTLMNSFKEENKNNEQAVESLKNQLAPSFVAKDVNGKTINLAALKGKVVVLNFWFIHVMPVSRKCLNSTKLLQNLKEKT